MHVWACDPPCIHFAVPCVLRVKAAGWAASKEKTMKLQTNENSIDRTIRIALGVIMLAMAAAGAVAAPWLYLAWIVGALALVTGIVGFCPLYAILRISTAPARR